MEMKRCHACLKELEIKIPVGRQETCPFCQSDLHCCLNCAFYVMGSYNSCREPQAERVIEKNRSNFCGYFVFRDSVQDNKEKEIRDGVKAKLEALFKVDREE
jgi:hypothetical protein